MPAQSSCRLVISRRLLKLPLNPSQPITSTKLTFVGYALTKWFKLLFFLPLRTHAIKALGEVACSSRTCGNGFATPVL